MREIWEWSLPAAAALAGALGVIDFAFFSANVMKIAEGGYVPLLLAGSVYFIMVVWHVGATTVARRLHDALEPIDAFMAKVEKSGIPRVPGTAVFLTRTQGDVPPVMVWHVKHNRALHERLFVLTVLIRQVPWAREGERLTFAEVAPNFWRATAQYGFMERPDIPVLLAQAHAHGCKIDLSDVTYYVGHETVVHREEGAALPRWIEEMYAAMQRNSVHVSDFFRLPAECVVEIGREVAI